MSSRKHPFTEAIMEVSLSATWKSPTITDPDEHADAYLTQISLYTADDTLMCRVFPTSLKETTLNWFTLLLPACIDCFDTLVFKFSAQFATSKHHHLTSLALVNIR